MTTSPTTRTIEAVYRMEAGRLIGGLLRLVRDLDQAEELAQDALVAALEVWSSAGVPDNPGAWLMTTAKRRGLDRLRRERMIEAKHLAIGREQPSAVEHDLAAALDDAAVGDDLLRLVFAACHPVIPKDARVALTLRLVCGLSTAEIARAYLVAEPTIGQRIVRAKRALGAARVPFEVPSGPELVARVAAVLEVVYLVFNEGYSATAGDDWTRPGLCEDAQRLARTLARLLPDEPEVHGLLALLELQASRLAARVGPEGQPILLLDQDRSRWDHLLIRRGLEALARAEALRVPLGPYTLQAAIAACHARARVASATDWVRIVALYDALVMVVPSPVVELNRAVAVAMAFGPGAGLELVDQLVDEPQLSGYHLLPAVRGDLLAKLGRHAEARHELERAAFLTENGRERELLLSRARALS